MKRIVSVLSCLLVTSVIIASEPAGFLGSDSCASSTCHGNVIGRGPAWNHSLSTWIASDPHVRSGEVLREPVSIAIVNRLNPASSNSSVDFDNTLRTRCLSCHTTVTADQCDASGTIDDSLLSAGVSCEGCHGAAERWISSHTRADWSDTSGLDSIIGRAENCVRCHVGSRSSDGLIRDMNHDLIAAGHPVLRFDLAIYIANLPKHWSDDSESELVFRESVLRTRRVGRSINLAAAAALSAERAADHLRGESTPWPELSDYDCFACHQSLSIGEYKLPARGKTKSPLHVSDGLPVWNSWHSVNQLELRENRELLRKLSPHRSDPKAMALGGAKLAEKYRKIADDQMKQSVEPRQAIDGVLQQLRETPPIDWHEAAIQYLELDAGIRDLAKASRTDADEELFAALAIAERLLRFDRDSTVDSKATFQSPIKFDADEFRRTLLSTLDPENLQ